MAAGEGGADSLPPPSATSPGPLPGPERALEEAVASGSLSLAGRRLRHFPGGVARRWDLSDTTQADLSRNRFAEVPEDTCHLMSLEGLSLYHNCLRSLPSAIANLQALTYLNVSRNQLSALPSSLCRLPLKILIASNNRLASLPDEIGLLSSLRQLDVSSNELQSLPGTMGGLESLRDLSIRRNQIAVLPEELAELPLVRLDFSCNLVTRIPACYRQLRYLQCILLENNPLQSPPAQICGKGRLHIFKYLHLEACGKARPDLAEFVRGRPTGFGTCLSEDFYAMRQYGGLDSGFNSVDSGSKRWSGNESTDEFSDLSFRITELARDPQYLQERRHGADAAGDPEQIDCIDSSLNGEGEEQEEGRVSCKEPLAVAKSSSQGAPGRGSSGSCLPRPEAPAEEPRRPQLLQLWQERERQQQLRSTSSSSRLSQPKPSGQGVEQPTGSPRQEALHRGSRSPGPLSPSRSWAGLQAVDEKERTLQLCEAIESRLNITLAKDLGEALADGTILCQLANQLCPRSVPFVHMPSPAGPKLNAVKSRKNVQSFLAACRQLGLPEASLCSASDIGCLLQGNARGLLRLLEALLLRPAARSPLAPAALSEHLAGFGLFYAFVMWLLYLAYRKLCGCC